MKIYVKGMIMMMNVIRKDDLHVKTLIIMKTNVKRERLLVTKAKAIMSKVVTALGREGRTEGAGPEAVYPLSFQFQCSPV